MEYNAIKVKSKAFAIRIIRLYQHLQKTKKEYVMTKQLLRSATSIAANVKEALVCRSDSEFISKMNIALMEASESELWLELLHETDYLTEKEFQSIYPDCTEIVRLLISIIKTMNEKKVKPKKK